MYLCYIDESGTSDIPGNTSHFILAGLAIPIWQWRNFDSEIESIKQKYFLSGSEIHVAWILRPYYEQKLIRNFNDLDHHQRRSQIETYRKGEILRLQRANREEELFDLIFQRVDRKDDVAVGVRHYTSSACTCKICTSHRKCAPFAAQEPQS
jgi:hypothetical protein